VARRVSRSTIYLVRHGIAAERGAEYPDDSARPLTSDGIARFRRQAMGLDHIGVTIDLILTSPLTRARQTADLLAARLLRKGELLVVQALAPSAPAGAIIDEISNHTNRRYIALVGHEPDLGELAARLIGASSPLPLKKGGVCRIDFTGGVRGKGEGSLTWMVTPKMLRLLAPR
jgi:phosphohistidine phosphatase